MKSPPQKMRERIAWLGRRCRKLRRQRNVYASLIALQGVVFGVYVAWSS